MGIERFASSLIGSLLTRKLAAAKEKLEKQQGEGERVAALEEQVRSCLIRVAEYAMQMLELDRSAKFSSAQIVRQTFHHKIKSNQKTHQIWQTSKQHKFVRHE